MSNGDIGAYLNQGGGGGDTSGGGIGFQGGGGNFQLFNQLLDSLFGSGASSHIQGTEMGTEYGSMLGPWGAAGGAIIGGLYDLFNGLFGDSVPTGAKTAGAAQELLNSPDPQKRLLGQIIAQSGGVLSDPSSIRKIGAMGDIVEYLTGRPFSGLQQMPGHKGVGELMLPPPAGAPYSRDVGVSGLLNPQGLKWLFKGLPLENLTPTQAGILLPWLMKNLNLQPGEDVTQRGIRDVFGRLMHREHETDLNKAIQDFLNQHQPQPQPPGQPPQQPNQPNPRDLFGSLFGGGGFSLTHEQRGPIPGEFGPSGPAFRPASPSGLPGQQGGSGIPPTIFSQLLQRLMQSQMAPLDVSM